MTKIQDLLRELQLLELYLLHHDHQLEPEYLDRLLAPEFYEIANNGSRVKRDAVMEWLLKKDKKARWELSQFSGIQFGGSSAHVVYHARQVAGQVRPSEGSWRSSIWRYSKQLDMWQICFHQATKVQS